MKSLRHFLKKRTSSSIILIITTMFAMVLSNLNTTKQLYHAFLNIPIGLHIGTLSIDKNMLFWINNGFMVVFFLLIGLEIKREVVQGSLSCFRKAAFPVIAALGGIVVPALIYLVFNHKDPIVCAGWAIPIPTDIAFALGVLALLGRIIPIELKIFLMALAVIDDLIAIIVIAFFYTSKLSILFLSIALLAVIILAVLNVCNVLRTDIYIFIGIILWVAILKSGVHATLAGIIISFFIPLDKRLTASQDRQLEHILYPWVEFIILPLFAFANAGISLHSLTLNELTLKLPLGIIIGLFAGKPVGINLFCWLALKFKVASLPVGITFQQITLVSILCGIGFTMSIFIANLAFDSISPQLIVLSKFSILLGSLLAAFFGFILLKVKLPEKKKNNIMRSRTNNYISY